MSKTDPKDLFGDKKRQQLKGQQEQKGDIIPLVNRKSRTRVVPPREKPEPRKE